MLECPGQLSPDWQRAFFRLRPLLWAELRESPHLFLGTAGEIVYRGSSSGSQGRPLIYFAGQQWDTVRNYSRDRAFLDWGIGEDTPILNVASRLFPLRPKDGVILGTVDEGFLEEFLGLIEGGFRVLRGYPSRLCEVAGYLQGKRLPRLQAVICTGEVLFAWQMALLEATFQCPVINKYGCPEAGVAGLSCSAGRLHLQTERCFFEEVEGEVLVTDLYNTVMPIIRYQWGDVLQLYDTPCLCGREGVTGNYSGGE
ncbi:hypothetical protein PN462_21275 [Spirulina sp. CS-785/01]|uniref:hypothetical protein n=1 Tax=Spirulina sp. CS-785/01 TaxID=3021716 RepID=UPI00232E99E1|nr:hypothetical protein [Spirulina sp. CS-785/01]MDB9315659.1 hypothetical protein [Spirulina sp. CS-785/01]